MSNLDKKITSATLTSYESFCITITNAPSYPEERSAPVLTFKFVGLWSMCSLSLDSIIQYSKVKVSMVPFQKNSAKSIECCAMYTKNRPKISSKNGQVRKMGISIEIYTL